MNIKRPILVGGLSLTAGLWLLDTLQNTVFDHTVLMGTLLLGAGGWWLRRKVTPAVLPALRTTPIDRTVLEQALAKVDAKVTQIEAELPEELRIAEHRQESHLDSSLWMQIHQIQAAREQVLSECDLRCDPSGKQTQLCLAIVGEKGTGKTALLNHLQTHWLPGLDSDVTLTEFSALVPSDASATQPELPSLATQDLVLLVVTGDITASTVQQIQTWLAEHHRVVLVFNKQDQYSPSDRSSIFHSLESRVSEWGDRVSVVSTAAAPSPIKVRRHQTDGQIKEHLESSEPDLTALLSQLSILVTEQVSSLVVATALRQAEGLQRQAQQILNGVRRDRALPMIDQYQWIAAAAAFANPLPSLDVLATAAINAQLISDLGGVYGQRFSLDQAKAAAGTLANLMLKLGLVELSTQALSVLLKSHAVTYVAGGMLQGMGAAYLTRLAGMTLIDYFEAQSFEAQSALDQPTQELSLEAVGQILQTVFQRMQRTEILKTLVQQGLDRFLPQAETALPAATTPSLMAESESSSVTLSAAS